MTGGKVLVLGADGFLGRHIVFALRAAGWQVLASARRVDRLAEMGFETLQADLCDPRAHDPTFWRDALAEVTAVVNAAGLLTGPEARFRAVHETAPRAILGALPAGAHGILISAIGIDEADTPFARHRRAGEHLALAHGMMVLRPGLVLGDTSYGGSSLLRGLAAAPLATPVVGDGTQPFNPIHADDLAAAVCALLAQPVPSGIYPIGGPETLTQTEMVRAYRRWLGLRPVPVLRLPLPLARGLGTMGDALRLGPVSRSAVDQLTAGVHAVPDPRLPGRARPFSDFHADRPAGTQDLWHARLYLIRPVLRLALAFLWLASGVIGIALPPSDFLPLLPDTRLPDTVLVALARLGGLADLAIALALLRAWRLKLTAAVQFAMIAAYTLTFSLLAPGLWLLPLGGVLKNIPLLCLVAIHAVLEDER